MQVKMNCCLLVFPLIVACGGGSGGTDDPVATDSGDPGKPLDVPKDVPEETGFDVVAEEGVIGTDLIEASEAIDPGPDGYGDEGPMDSGDLLDPGQELPPQPCVEDEDCEQGPDFDKAWNCSGYFCHKPTGQCVLADFPDGYPCKPRSECEKPEGVCESGECVGEAVDCDDGNLCTDDSCDKDLGCQHSNNQVPCDDGTDCTLLDVCQDGECVGTDNQCECQEDADCLPLEDGNLCNGVLTCEADFCVVDPLSIIQCMGRSTGSCKSLECEPSSGSCVESSLPDGTECDDQDPCTQGDVCLDGVCAGPVDLPCDDGNPCSDEECISAQGGCVFTANTADCDDGNECTQGDVCQDFQCVGKATIDCGCEVNDDCLAFEDGNACNGTLVCNLDQCVVDPATLVLCDKSADTDCLESVCNPADGTCSQVAIAENEPCDDGDACTLDSLCQGGQCVDQGPQMVCDDNDICNGLESCDATIGCVAGLPLACNDQDACNGLETCDPLVGCLAGVPLVCDDNDLCNGLETCDALAGCLAGVPLTCDDGDACNGMETCDALTGCVAGVPPTCDDNDTCNGLETCDTVLGCVAGTPLVCNDKDACNGLETCDAVAGCQNGTPPVCDDQDVCNGLETCDSLTGCLQGSPLNCVDGTECTDDLCDPLTGCSNPPTNEGGTCTLPTGQDGVCIQGECILGCQSDNECDDAIGCTTDSCNTLFAECEFEAVDEACDDNDLCTGQETCDPVVGCVAGTPLDCSDGDACNGQEFCVTGEGCADGPPPVCDDGDICNGLETCDTVLGCLPGVSLVCDDNDACNGQETCHPVDGCLPGVAPDCTDENPCTDVYCNPVTGCVVESANEGEPCQTVAGDWGQCVGGGCSTDCQGDDDCDDGVPCTVDTCDTQNGMCLFEPVDADCDDGDACNGEESCDVASGCVDGTPPICDDSDPCNGLETCHPVDGCMAGEALVCDDEDACNGTETCVQFEGCQEGTPLTCDDGDACNGLETCDPASGCVAGTALSCDDEDACNGLETCDTLVGCMPGNPLHCDDEDVCTGTETCDPATGCVDGTALVCNDDDACNGLETCDPTTGCADGTPLVCGDDDVCNGTETCDPATGCVDGTALVCDDNDACTGTETCNPATGCEAGTPLVCGDDDVCNGTETCDPATGCVDGTALVCLDSDACNGTETCNPVTGCEAGTPLTCDDGNPCNGVETCDAATGCVAGDPVDCSDGNACNGLEFCDPANGCQDADPLVCDDENVCNGSETCDPAVGCVAGVDLDCQDEDACNGSELCDPVDGCGPGFPLFCDDYNVCNGSESCDTALGCVSGTPMECDDGNACNGVETCDPSAGCRPGTALVCDDQNPCNGEETCDPATGCVAGTPLVCEDDGDKCNGEESCDVIQGCISTSPPSCDDDDKCNGLEWCDPAVGCTAGIPLTCDDSNQCNGVETCDALAGCVAGTPMDCDDGDQCNGVEECNPAEGCVAGIPMPCNDGEQCNGEETCDSETGCVPGTPLECDDGNACNGTEQCVIGGIGCISGIPPQCDDADVCNGVETCDPATGCVAGTALDCDDGNVCNGTELCFPLDGCTDGAPLICDDQDPCNGVETCDTVEGCQSGPITVCEGKECGDDGCGGSCGDCSDGMVCNTNFECQDVGDDCLYPVQITAVPQIVNGSTVTSAADYQIGASDCPGVMSSAGAASPDNVYSFSPTATGDFDIILDPVFDSVLYVISDCETIPGNCFGADNQPGTDQETLTLQMFEGQTYYIIVDGASDISPVSGAYQLTLKEACSPQCQGKDCGDDGCGGSCGECPIETACTSGTQVCEPLLCPAMIDCIMGCDDDQACIGGCEDSGTEGTLDRAEDAIDCLLAECGPDPSQACTDTAWTGACATEADACDNDTGCTPDCTGKLCGDDGCGGSCGSCDPGDLCGPLFECVLAGTDCDVPIVVESLPFADAGDTSLATSDLFFGDDTCPFQAQGRGLGSPDIVYQYTPSRDLNVSIDLAPGSGFDTALYVYSGNCDTVTSTSCQSATDNPGDASPEELVLSLTQGTTYYIVVDGFSNSTPASGAYGLDIAEIPPYVCLEMVDVCLRDCLGDPDCMEHCSSLGSTLSETTYGALMSCVYGEPPDWSPCDPTSSDPTCLDTALAGECAAEWEDCEDDTGCMPDCKQSDGVTPKECGGDGCGGSCGTCPSGESCDGGNICVLSGDTCEVALPVDALPFVHQGDTSVATDDHSFGFGQCSGVLGGRGGASPDIVYSFTPADTQDYIFTLEPNYDSVLYVTSNCESIGSATCLGADEEDGVATEELTLGLTSGTTYYVIVDGGSNFLELSGSYTLTIEGLCEPDCTGGKVCGDDGCGGSCGDCPQGTVCTASQVCGPYLCPDAWDCVVLCGDDTACADACFAAATPGSLAILNLMLECLSFCGEQPDPPTCVDGALTGTCASEYQACLDDTGCTPDCDGKACGDNGCGGTCGECSSGQYCDAQGACHPEGDQCDHAIVVESLPYVHTGDTTGAGADYSFGTSSCPGENGARGGASSDIVHAITLPGDGTYTILLTAAFDSSLYVVTDCDDIGNSCLAAIDEAEGVPEELSLDLTGGTTYYVIVDGYSNSSNVAGGYSLSISMDGDDCTAPIEYTGVPVLHAGDTSTMSNAFSATASVCPGMDTTQGMLSPDQVVEFTPQTSESFDISLDAQYPASMYMVTDCNDVGTSCLGAVEENTDDPAKLTLDLTSGTTYYIIVDGMGDVGANQGAFSLSVDQACTPDCSGGKICGDDGCGGSCGECPQGTWCSGSTTCVATTCSDLIDCVRGCPVLSTCFDLCDDTGSPPSASLYWDVIDCVVVECGSDPDLACFDGAVAGACSTQGDACTADAGCVPDCEGKVCGDDGCQGSCGTCDTQGMVCNPTGACVPEGQDCDVAIPVTVPASVTGYTSGGSNTYAFATGECPGEAAGYGFNSEDRVYTFSPASTGSYQVTLTPDNFDSVVYVVSDCADITNTCLGAAEEDGVAVEQLTVSLTSGTTYYVIVDGASSGSDAGTYTLAVDPVVE